MGGGGRRRESGTSVWPCASQVERGHELALLLGLTPELCQTTTTLDTVHISSVQLF